MKVIERGISWWRSPSSPALSAVVFAAWSIAWLAACSGPSEAPRRAEYGEPTPAVGDAAVLGGEADEAMDFPAAPAFRPPESSPPYLKARIGSPARSQPLPARDPCMPSETSNTLL